jgi:multisubunit Na+/H+ antiporter MnhE subunit
MSRAITYCMLVGVYFLFACSVTNVEVIAGVVAALVATIAAGLFGAAGVVRFRPRVAEVANMWRIPWDAVKGAAEVFVALARELFTKQGADSFLRAVPFDVGGDDAHSMARRTLALTYTTITPNFIVLGVVHEQSLLLFHQVFPSDVPQVAINLGARP